MNRIELIGIISRLKEKEVEVYLPPVIIQTLCLLIRLNLYMIHGLIILLVLAIIEKTTI
jgi:hypothetical protein